MTAEEVLKTVDFLAENVLEVRYQTDPRSYWINKAPAGWCCGQVLLRVNFSGDPNLLTIFQNKLIKLGVVNESIVGVDGGKNNAIKFKMRTLNREVVAILDAAMEKKKLRRDAKELENMNQHVDGLIKDMRNMRPGLFHTGFNAVKNMTDVLDRARARYEKHR